MPSKFRRLVRAACSLLILLGLGTSALEGASCPDSDARAVTWIVTTGANGFGDAGQPGTSQPDAETCCPCVHTFPSEFKATIVPVLPLVGYTTRFTWAFQVPLDRHPQPLVPPPIA